MAPFFSQATVTSGTIRELERKPCLVLCLKNATPLLLYRFAACLRRKSSWQHQQKGHPNGPDVQDSLQLKTDVCSFWQLVPILCDSLQFEGANPMGFMNNGWAAWPGSPWRMHAVVAWVAWLPL